MAILLGAFIIQGIVPGPDLLDPGKHLTLTFSFVWIIVVSNIITVAICFLFLNQLVKITYVKGTFLIPFLLLLIYLGGFAVKNSFGDMVLVLLVGALGWVMVQCDWQRPPLLLGLVLGSIAEQNLFISTRIYGAAWLLRPGVIILSLLILGAILYPAFQRRRERGKKAAIARVEPVKIPERATPGNLVLRILLGLYFVGVFAYVLYEAQYGFGAWERRAALFPMIVGSPSLLLALWSLGSDISSLRFGLGGRPGPARTAVPGESWTVRFRTAAICSWITGFLLVIWLLGFTIAAPLMTFLYLKIGAGERWLITVFLAIFAWLFFYGIFDYGIHLPFPKGEIFYWLR